MRAAYIHGAMTEFISVLPKDGDLPQSLKRTPESRRASARRKDVLLTNYNK
ncbi:hypothetical protein [Pseudomonas sp.]|uniref:hypothetical protein n=1 Tax=Pseudomonas sp. TaxID=306 RepID=UPI00261A6353|nr:hypothetical protein [Pseudomonas sp.]